MLKNSFIFTGRAVFLSVAMLLIAVAPAAAAWWNFLGIGGGGKAGYGDTVIRYAERSYEGYCWSTKILEKKNLF